jgi:hypothetical protein
LYGIFLVYLGVWIKGNRGLLFDPMFQNNDVRTHLIGFHRYTEEKALADDPIAAERLATVPPGLRFLYHILVPISGLYVASKIVQAMCFFLVFLAGILLMLSNRGSAASGMILIFFVLHSPNIVIDISGGLQRNFFIPLFLLWAVGAITKKKGLRFASVLMAVLAYPPAMAMMLVTEGILMMKDLFGSPLKTFVSQLKHFAILFFACVILMFPYFISTHRGDHIHSLGEAREDPTFSMQGRVPALPFPEPIPAFAAHFSLPFLTAANQIRPNLPKEKHEFDPVIALIVVAVLAFLMVNRFFPVPGIAIIIFMGSVSMYIIARLFAFKLYWPYRYYQFGMPFTATVLCVMCLGLCVPFAKKPFQNTIRNVVAILGMIVLIVFSGSGVKAGVGNDIDGRDNKNLYEFVRTLPMEARIAAHPMDGSDIPYWTGRATTYSFETLQPWFVEGWKSQKTQTEDTLKALYATSKEEVLSYCKKYSVTHFLLRTSRYSRGFKKSARLFEPFGSFVKKLLEPVEWKELVLARVPRQAIVFREGDYVLADVDLLLDLWSNSSLSN